MKNVSFLVAVLAMLQFAASNRAQAQVRIADHSRPTVEEALDQAGDEIGQELEQILEQLGLSAERLGKQLEHWAEDNSEELEAWSQKYGPRWEAWSNRFGQKMERLAGEQENIWNQWAKGYERDLERWSEELESTEEFAPELIGEFVEQNLKSLSKMPLGQLVDRALDEGLGELSDAPWDSLEELGILAQDALEQPLNDLAETFDENSEQRRAIEQSARELRRALEQLKEDVGRNRSDDDRVAQDEDPRVLALKKMLVRDDLSRQQRERIAELIKTIEDANAVGGDVDWSPRTDKRAHIDVPQRDQIQAKIDRERQRHEATMQQFNEDLRRSSEESRKEAIRKRDQRARELDRRQPKGVDGKNLGPEQRNKGRAESFLRTQRDGRDGKANRKPVATTDSAKKSATKPGIEMSDLEELRAEIERLREEVKRLKEKSDK